MPDTDSTDALCKTLADMGVTPDISSYNNFCPPLFIPTSPITVQEFEKHVGGGREGGLLLKESGSKYSRFQGLAPSSTDRDWTTFLPGPHFTTCCTDKMD